MQGLQAAELAGPFVALLRLAALGQAPHQGEQQRERVLADGPRVQARAGGDDDVLAEARGEDPLDPGGEGLDQPEPAQVLRGGFQVAAGGAPDHERGRVVMGGGDLLAGVDDDGLPALGQRRVQRHGVRKQDLHAPQGTERRAVLR